MWDSRAHADHSPVEPTAALGTAALMVYDKCDLLNIQMTGKRDPIWSQSRRKLLH